TLLRHRSAGEPRRPALRDAFELLGQAVETGMDLAEFLAGERALAFDLNFALALLVTARLACVFGFAFALLLAARLVLDVGFVLAVVARLALLVARTAPLFAAMVAARFLARFLARFVPRLIAPVVVVVVVISDAHWLAMIVVALLDDVVEPLPDRHAGTARRVAGSFARLWTEASEIPRTARFHCAPNHFGRNEMALFLSGGSLTDEAEGAVYYPRL
ncbi:MAG: hypothetical protein WCA56_18845, partial [Xanthobacteraceae bacterium]